MKAPAAAIVTLVVAGAALTGCTAIAPVGHAELQLVGGWTGAADDDGNGIIEMVVAESAADGTTFDGDLTFTVDGAETTEPVHASMTPHGHLVASIGEDASVEVHIVDPKTLDYCFIRYGVDFIYSCGRLVRAS
jgi:hypothetical protein